MKSKFLKNPCCNDFERHTLDFVDESTNLDKQLLLIGQFCSSVLDPNYFTEETFQELGSTLRRYLDKRAILESVFFGRDTEQVMDVGLAATKEKTMKNLIIVLVVALSQTALPTSIACQGEGWEVNVNSTMTGATLAREGEKVGDMDCEFTYLPELYWRLLTCVSRDSAAPYALELRVGPASIEDSAGLKRYEEPQWKFLGDIPCNDLRN